LTAAQQSAFFADSRTIALGTPDRRGDVLREPAAKRAAICVPLQRVTNGDRSTLRGAY
jgi:hypothetical protein